MNKQKSIVTSVHSHCDTTAKPTLLTFQNGVMSAVNKHTTKYCPIEHQETGQRGALVVAGGHTYHGLVGEGKSAVDELTDDYIFVRNKRTNTVRVIPINKVLLKNSVFDSSDQLQSEQWSKEKNQEMLHRQYGGRKEARMVAHRENMKMNVSTIQNELDTTVQEFKIESFDESNLAQARVELLRPKYNKDAKQLQEIYNIYDVVPKELLDRLDGEAKVVFSTEIENLPIKSDFLKGLIRRIQSSTPSEKGMLHIKLIIYMDGLINLLRSRIRKLKGLELSTITERVENDILERFKDPHSNMRTQYVNEKATCYFMVLALLVSENYCIDIDQIVQELHASKQKIAALATIISAEKKRGNSQVQLILPSKIKPIPARFLNRTM